MRLRVVLGSLLGLALVGVIPLALPDFWVAAPVVLLVILLIVPLEPVFRFVAGNSFKRPGRRLAAARGDVGAMRALGFDLLLADRPDKAEPWLRRAVEGGHAAAAYDLAVLLDESDRSAEAQKWYRRFAESTDRPTP